MKFFSLYSFFFTVKSNKDSTDSTSLNNLCNQTVDDKDENYLVGYGSLLEEKSRNRTNPDVEVVYPIEIQGFKRIWGFQLEKYKSTFLTIISDDKSTVNAVYYPIKAKDFIELDIREEGYCRMLISKEKLKQLGSKEKLKQLGLDSLPEGKYWIYANMEKNIPKPSVKHPIPQSYVDIFLNGCIEIGEKYEIDDFLDKCITLTYEWPTDNDAWVNDRIHPRRPFVIPNYKKIDKKLSATFSNYHDHPFDHHGDLNRSYALDNLFLSIIFIL